MKFVPNEVPRVGAAEVIGRIFDPTKNLSSLAVFVAACIGVSLIMAGLLQALGQPVGTTPEDTYANFGMAWIFTALALLIGVPLCVAFLDLRHKSVSEYFTAEAVVLVITTLVLVAVAHGVNTGRITQVCYLSVILLLLWTAVRCHTAITLALLLIVAVADLYFPNYAFLVADSSYASHAEKRVWAGAVETVRAIAILIIAASSRGAKELSNHDKLQSRRLSSVIDTSNDGIITINEWGIVDSFNRAAQEIFGFAPAEVIGKNVNMLMPSFYRERHDGYLGRYLATGERKIIGIGRVVTGQRKDGSTFPMELSVGEMKMGERRIFTGFVRDISARQETEMRLHELQEELFHVSRVSAMGELASAIAHELNQPLAAIKNYAMAGKLMLQKSKSTKEIPALLDKMNDQAGRAGDVIKRLRNFISNKKIETTQTDIYQVTTEASALALIGAKEDGIKTTFVRNPNIPAIAVDRVQIQQVLINLIRNAVDAMRDSPRRELLVETRISDSKLLIRVCDTGPGVPPDAVDKLFMPFFSSKPSGMGIGLSISRAIAEAHGGSLDYEPNPLGGAIFVLGLPLPAQFSLSAS